MFAEDLAPFFEDLGVDATVNGTAVRGHFDNAYATGAVGPYGMASTQPILTLPTSDVPASPVGMAVVLGAGSFLVAAHEPDGTGISRLVLESAT